MNAPPSLNLPADLIAPVMPPGYDTAWTYLARTEPWTLDLMMDPINGLVVDDRKAREVAKELGVTVMTMAAPEVLRAAGVQDVAAAPEAVWEIVFVVPSS